MADERAGVLTRIVVVSVTEAVERRARFEEQACFAAVPWSFYPVQSGLHLSLRYDDEEAIRATGRPMLAAELAVYSSHYRAWQELQSDNVHQYVVLTDDLIVDWAFIGKLAEIDLPAIGIDYLHLNHRYPVRSRIVWENFIDQGRFIVELAGSARGGLGYAITKAGAKIFLDRCRTVLRPLDEEMSRAWSHGHRNLSVFPSCVMETSDVPDTCETQPVALTGSRVSPPKPRRRWKLWRSAAIARPRQPVARDLKFARDHNGPCHFKVQRSS
jgi:GR25 family glycosyltransferase involved in LPS biosynthesis